jgi:hypothetical protein
MIAVTGRGHGPRARDLWNTGLRVLGQSACSERVQSASPTPRPAGARPGPGSTAAPAAAIRSLSPRGLRNSQMQRNLRFDPEMALQRPQEDRYCKYLRGDSATPRSSGIFWVSSGIRADRAAESEDKNSAAKNSRFEDAGSIKEEFLWCYEDPLSQRN